MDTAQSSQGSTSSQLLKRKRGTTVEDIVRNVRSWVFGNRHRIETIKEENTDAKLTSIITGVPLTTVYAYTSNDLTKYKPPMYVKKAKTTPKGHYRIVSSALLDGIKNVVIDLYKTRQPTLEDIQIKLREEFPNELEVSRLTLYRIMKNKGFVYRKTSTNRDLFMEKQHVKDWRARYLIRKKQILEEGRKVFYTDETWFSTDDCYTKAWQHNDLPEAQVSQKSGGRGKRFIVCHIGSKDGFVPDGDLIFDDRDQIYDDYHKSMTAEVYEEWIERLASEGKVP